jgi:hypothetical protein
MPSYHPNRPAGCPPRAAKPMTGPLYCRIGRAPAVARKEDFYSQREKGISHEGRECQRWGLSVSIHLEDVRNELSAYPYLLKKFQVVEVQVKPEHGVILHTPTDERPNHQTFWRDINTDFCQLSKIIDPFAGRGG